MFDTRFTDGEFKQRTGDLRLVRLAGQPYVQGVNHPKVVYFLPLTLSSGEDDAGHGTHGAADAAGMKVRAPGADRVPGTDEDPIVEGVAPRRAADELQDVRVDPLMPDPGERCGDGADGRGAHDRSARFSEAGWRASST